jgi:hypothetical protein
MPWATTNDTHSLAPRAAYLRDRAERLAQFAYQRDSKNATRLALELRQLAAILAAIEVRR